MVSNAKEKRSETARNVKKSLPKSSGNKADPLTKIV
jgi:hypothetical protein